MSVTANNVRNVLGKHILTDGLPQIIDFEKSEGSWMVDKATGQRYLDCFGQFASLPLGYNHPRLLQYKDRLTQAALCKVVNSDLYSCEYASFVQTLFKKALPDHFKYAFFIEGGSPAIENCLKIAFDWKAKRLKLTDALSQNLDIIHMKECFHGRGGYTMSLTNTGPIKINHFPKFKWTRILNPKVTFPMDVEHVVKQEEHSLAQAEHALKRGNVAAVIMEPIQGEGGNNMFRIEYFQALAKLADKYEALLIFDEVQTGVGASGKWWCHEYYGVVPDLMAFGKKLQVCGVVAYPKRLDMVKDHCFKRSGRINSTWGGNIVDMVRAEAIIHIIEKDGLVEHAQKVGSYLIGKLREIEAVSALLSNVRGLGTLVAFDLPTSDVRDRVIQKLQQKMTILGCGEKSIRFRPALTFTKADVDIAVEYVREGLK